MCNGYLLQSCNAYRAGYTRYVFCFDVELLSILQLFMPPSEYKRISAFETNNVANSQCIVNNHFVDFILRKSVMLLSFANINFGNLRRSIFQQFWIYEGIVQYDIRF